MAPSCVWLRCDLEFPMPTVAACPQIYQPLWLPERPARYSGRCMKACSTQILTDPCFANCNPHPLSSVVQPIGPFGTESDPVLVESIFDERIMGCPGDCAGGDTRANNEVRWFVVSAAKPYTCPTCKQVRIHVPSLSRACVGAQDVFEMCIDAGSLSMVVEIWGMEQMGVAAELPLSVAVACVLGERTLRGCQ